LYIIQSTQHKSLS